MQRFASNPQLRAMISRRSSLRNSMTWPVLRRVRKRGRRARIAALRRAAGAGSAAASAAGVMPAIGDLGIDFCLERQREQIGQIAIRGLKILHLGQIDREAGIAVHEAHGMAVVAGDYGDGLVLAGAQPDLAGEAGYGT